MPRKKSPKKQKISNLQIGFFVFACVVFMVGLSFASVPLYRLFCQVTGYGGTPQISEGAPAEVFDRKITVYFNADINPDLPWSFKPGERSVNVRVGESALTFYTAENTSSEALSGMATYNVTPLKVGQYFHKVRCFCFDEQRLNAGEKVEMPVQFYIDPDIMRDRGMDDVTAITLSYTFFPFKED